jgi:hypothetical protein
VNLQALMSALPWAKRVWKVLPPQGRILVLILAAIASLVYAMRSSKELDDVQARAERAGTTA